MHSRKLLFLVLLGMSLSAVADFRTVTEVHEIDLPNVRLPGIDGGTLAFKGCDDCEVQTLRVDRGARYVLNDRAVTLAKFKSAISGITNRNNIIIDVYHHLESNTVTAVMVKL